MKQNTYKAQNIQVLKDLEVVRNKYNIFQLSEQIKKRGDNSKLAKILNIKESVLSRAICEAKILSIFPDITLVKIIKPFILKSMKYKIGEKNE